MGKAIKRRGILAAAAVVVAEIMAKQASEPVAAATSVTLANGIDNTLNNEMVPTYLRNTGNNIFKHEDAAVLGESDNGPGVYGSVNFAATPEVPFSVGVYGDHGNASGIGVHGLCAAASGTGVLGQGDATSGIGVKGISANGFPIFGQIGGGTNTNAAVGGLGTMGPGVQGQSAGGYGLVGFTSDTHGHAGLIGFASAAGGIGLIGNGPGGVSPGLAGVFNGDVIVNGALRVYGSPKSAAVKHPGDGTYRLLYCEESPESWFADYGSGALVGGRADVKLDATFAALVHADAYHVFLTAKGDSRGLYVADQTATGFTVREQQGGTSDIAFDYRVVAKRKDIVGERLAKVAPPPPLKTATPFTVPTTPEVQPPAKKP